MPVLLRPPRRPGNRHIAIFLATRTFLSDTRTVRGNEFVRRIQALGKERGVEVRWTAHRGKGSHGLLYYGVHMTTVRNLKDEVDKRAYHKMLRQLNLSERELE
jgi:mRNA interferase HicA